jgi:phenylpropionate dioxygenase-like ring-hydroxylating dioxygenase large terminal subunit
MIFVNIDGNAAPLAEHLRGLNEILEPDFDFSDLETGGSWATEYPGNWKITVEGAIEDYHLPICHPQFVRGAAERDLKLELEHEAERFFLAGSRRTYQDPARGGQVAEDSLPNLLRQPGSDVSAYFLTVFPSAFVTVRTTHIVAGVVLPDGHAKTTLNFRYQYRSAAVRDPKFTPARTALETMWREVYLQDVRYVQSLQRNAQQPGDSGIRPRFSPYWESNVVHFQQTVVRALEGVQALEGGGASRSSQHGAAAEESGVASR